MALEQAIETSQKNHPGRKVTQFNISMLVCTTYEKSASMKNTTSAFRKAVGFPYNRHFSNGLDFAVASVYEHAPVTENVDTSTTWNSGVISENPVVTQWCQPSIVPIEGNDFVVSATALQINIFTIKDINTDTEGNETDSVTIEKDVAIEKSANIDTKVVKNDEKHSEIYVGCFGYEQ